MRAALLPFSGVLPAQDAPAPPLEFAGPGSDLERRCSPRRRFPAAYLLRPGLRPGWRIRFPIDGKPPGLCVQRKMTDPWRLDWPAARARDPFQQPPPSPHAARWSALVPFRASPVTPAPGDLTGGSVVLVAAGLANRRPRPK